MKGKNKGWQGESRRHSLARKGVSTVVDKDRRFDVSNFVARGKNISKKLDDIDGYANDNLRIIDEEISEFIRYRDEWVEFIEVELSKMGYDEGDIDDMSITEWANRIILEKIDDNLSIQTGQDVDDLSTWIEDQTGDKIDTKDIEQQIYDSIPLLDKKYESLVRTRDAIEVGVEMKLDKLGFSEDEIDEMQIEGWASFRMLDYIEDEMGWQRLIVHTDTLEEWIEDRGDFELKASGKLKSSGSVIYGQEVLDNRRYLKKLQRKGRLTPRQEEELDWLDRVVKRRL